MHPITHSVSLTAKRPPTTELGGRAVGALLGTAVGDALGLPGEGLRPDRIARQWGGVWRHRFLAGRGMVSDDTEHAAFVAQCLIENGSDAAGFRRALARRLRWWLAALPAGVGLATARAILRLWVGISPERSGVYSAGNGPMMRSAIIGVRYADDGNRRREFVAASTRITHTDPRAEIAALAVAELAASICVHGDELDPAIVLSGVSTDPEWRALVANITAAYAADRSVRDFAVSLGLEHGVTGYAWHTAPVAIYAWWHHRGDFRAAMSAALVCGGDTDTVGAIVGALTGAEVGEKGIPAEWISGICEWPRTVGWLRELGVVVGHVAMRDETRRAPAYAWPGVIPRNAFFLLVVLAHGFVRLVPR